MQTLTDLVAAVPPFVWQILGGTFAFGAGLVFAFYAVRGLRSLGRLATTSATDERKAATKAALSAAGLHILLYFFWAVAAGISMGGLVGFARDNMQLDDPWTYLLFFALDGAAAFCMVLVTRRASRMASTLVPRLAVWGLVAASSWFNHTHAADLPGGKVAWALIPVIAGVLFELAQAETRNQAANPERRLEAIQWLHPVERTRVLLELAADTTTTADDATVRVRDAVAAVWIYRLRTANRATRPLVRWRVRVAMARANFTCRERAEEILRRVQIFAQADHLAHLNYGTAIPARLALASLIGSEVDPALAAVSAPHLPVKSITGHVLEAGSSPTGPALAIAPRFAPFPASSAGAYALAESRTKSSNGITLAFPATAPGIAPGDASGVGGQQQSQQQNQGQPQKAKRPRRATYDRINKDAVTHYLERRRDGHEMTWQEMNKKYPRRSRGWCEDRIAEGQTAWQQNIASGGSATTNGATP